MPWQRQTVAIIKTGGTPTHAAFARVIGRPRLLEEATQPASSPPIDAQAIPSRSQAAEHL